MIEIEMSRDIKDYSPKFIGPFDKRQVVVLLIATAVGVPLFILLGSLPLTIKFVFTIIFILPIIMTGWIKIFGIPLEVFVWRYVIPNTLAPKKRVYMTENEYDVLFAGNGKSRYKADPLLRSIPKKKMTRREKKAKIAKLKKYGSTA